ncbi:hypothetical protein [Streptomyces sp. YIM B13518]|uniref:hypothetical protein n=1 Tax=Streptomyces sp. YIM B13518 TaxID=3366316 RepID=UPI0036AEE0E9
MVEAALGAEPATDDRPGCSDAHDIADRGAQVTPELVEEAQDVLAAAATPASPTVRAARTMPAISWR